MKKILLFCLILFSGSAFSQVNVTFQVDMRGYTISPVGAMFLNGTFNNWCGTCNPMTDANNDKIWDLTIPLPPGTIEYKFFVNNTSGPEILESGTPCTISSFGFTNRVLTFTGATVIPLNCFGACGACPTGPVKLPISLPITWQDTATVNYKVGDFGGNASSIVPSPTDPSALALKIIKTSAAETWGGTTLGTDNGFAANIPFSANSNQMQARVYSPSVGTKYLLKAEDKSNPNVKVETEATSTSANAWEVLTFNFAAGAQSPGTNEINYSFSYNKLSFFPNFGISGATAGEKTFYLGEVAFGVINSNKNQFVKNQVSVTPNPSSGLFDVSTSLEGNASIEISDLLGKVVYKRSDIISKSIIDISNVQNGIYLLKLSAGDKSSVNRIVVNK